MRAAGCAAFAIGLLAPGAGGTLYAQVPDDSLERLSRAR